MKRLLLVFFGLLFLISAGPIPVASARGWWWHHSRSNASPSAPKGKAKKFKASSEKHGRNNAEPLYSFPKSVGWWHRKSPGPAGAGVK